MLPAFNLLTRRIHSLLGLILLTLCACDQRGDTGYPATEKPANIQADARKYGPFPVSHNPQRKAHIGPEACVECHADAVADWQTSHHAKANRPISLELDRAAFTPARRIEESGVTYELSETDGTFELSVIDDGERIETYTLVGVIGYTPLRQYLAHLPGDKFQTISATYDVVEDRWFDVYAGQDRLPGEWGHWIGQGMNWNANCAYCHTTEYQKNYDFESDSYHSTWTQQGLACAECHSGLEEHVAAAKEGDYTRGLTPLTTLQTEHNCATCHSRRDQLTPDSFEIGDDYHDHFALSFPDQPNLYHHDGQILDEDFVYGSFQMSRMAHAGVSCKDCHNPHTLKPILPIENNLLCMRCHSGGVENAPVIEPLAHSFHSEGSTGNQCVNCHMSKTTYMQVDPRADHAFLSPDPLLTKELGIPNACNKCHTDQSVDWAVEWSEKWYGDAMKNHRQRKRARIIAAAHNFDPSALPKLLALLKDEDIPGWRATYTGLLANYLPNQSVANIFKTLAKDPSPMVRSRAASALESAGETEAALDMLTDSSRSVRLSAARPLAASQTIPDPIAKKDWDEYIEFNSDRPQSLLMLANTANREGRPADTKKYVERAIKLDQLNPEMYHQAAILLSAAKLNELAKQALNKGWGLAPKNPSFPYSLGLIAAEEQDLQTAIGYLEETVAIEPRFSRAWYNLSLAYRQVNRAEDAARALQRAQVGQ
jgi:tetratricopeptide (TPR) repeat protein